MISLIIIFGSSFITALSGALMPGPLLFYTIAETGKNGAWTGFFVIIGHAILELIIVVLLLLGFRNLLNKNIFEIIISLIGGITLFIMGLTMIIPALKNKLKLEDNTKIKKASRYLIISGIIVSISNPFFIIWWFFIGAGYLYSALKLGALGIIFFFIGHTLADMSWYVFVSYCIHKGKKIIGDTFYKYLIITCAFLIIAMGAFFIYNGTRLI